MFSQNPLHIKTNISKDVSSIYNKKRRRPNKYIFDKSVKRLFMSDLNLDLNDLNDLNVSKQAVVSTEKLRERNLSKGI